MNASAWFSKSVTEADEKLHSICESLSVPYRVNLCDLSGPKGEALNITVCRMGPADASKRLLVLSATHGVEGFAGAAIQNGWISCHHGDLAPDTAIVFVHQLNPWGMAWNRRENENNVDIFRNLNYLEHPGEADPLFDLVHESMDLANWHQRTPEWIENRDRLIERYGMDRIIAAVRRGQHHCPEGMTYHGNGPEWSAKVLLDVVDTELVGASHVAIIDIHTGFGEYGQPLVMSYDPPGSEQHTRVSEWFDGKIYTPGQDADIPSHLASLPFAWMNKRLPGTKITAEILEFGTLDPTTIGEIFNANHHFHIYGDPLSDEGLEWGAKYRGYCYPEEETWMEQVWHHGEDVLAKTLLGLEQWAGQFDTPH